MRRDRGNSLRKRHFFISQRERFSSCDLDVTNMVRTAYVRKARGKGYTSGLAAAPRAQWTPAGVVPWRRGMSRWGDLFGKRHVASGAEAGTLASGATAGGATAGGTTGKKPNR